MASLTRYVNTASSAGGDGTTNNTSGATRAYATLLEAINSLAATLTDQYTIYCSGTAADTSAINQTPWDMTTSATNYIHIIGEQSPNHPSSTPTGVYDTNLYRIEVTNTNAVYNNIPSHLRIEGLQVQVTVSDASSYVGIKTTNQNQVATDIDCRIGYCIVRGVLTSGTVIGFNTRFPDAGTGAGTSKVYNCLAYDCTTGFSNDFVETAGGEYYNCQSNDCQFGFSADDTMLCVNCLAAGTGDIGFVAGTFSANCKHNVSFDDTAPGANSHGNQTFTFTNTGTNDFSLTATDTGAKGHGFTDPASGLYSDDLEGTSRTGAVWDCGAFQVSTPQIKSMPMVRGG